MSVISLNDLTTQMRDWRHQLHRQPETAYTEFKTAELVAKVLGQVGINVHKGIAVTGVVGVLQRGKSHRRIGLRADMDALHIHEQNTFAHCSQVPGKMHGCGHDGHTAMLLGAACYLAKYGDFDGTIVFIFQPAEESEGGAKRMLEEGLFEQFPVDAVFGMHNMPTLGFEHFSICAGPMMAAFATFECVVQGVGTHASMPETGKDPIAPAMAIAQAWQAFHQQHFAPEEKVILSTTQFHAGDTWNVIPDIATLSGSTRCFTDEAAQSLQTEMARIAHKVCAEHDLSCEFTYKALYPPLINNEEETGFAAEVARSLVGDSKVQSKMPPIPASEDFAYILQAKRGAYILIGNDGEDHSGCMVHNPNYDFNDDILELGANYWIALAQKYLA